VSECEVGTLTVGVGIKQRIVITAISPQRRAITAEMDDRRRTAA
jgi:hypothetical protein